MSGSRTRLASLTLLAEDPELHLTPRAFFGRSAETQRGRLLEAVLVQVAEKGYAKASVEDICRFAGVSRTTFYEQFAGKDDCLLQASEVCARLMLERVAEAALQAARWGWEAALAGGTRRYVEVICQQPVIARALFIEMYAVGTPAIDARRVAAEKFTDSVLAMQQIFPAMPRCDDRKLQLIHAGIDMLVTQAILGDGRVPLAELADVAIDAIIAVIKSGAKSNNPGSDSE